MNAGRRLAGFTSLSAVLVALNLALAVTLVVTLVQQQQQRRRCSRLASEFRVIAAAFQQYHRQHGAWPAESNGAAGFPAGTESFLKNTSWLAGSPVGGAYQWRVQRADEGAAGKIGVVALTAFSPSPPLGMSAADFRRLDALVDDGDPETGRLRRGYNGWPVYHVFAQE